jgi:hypothetical protein
MHQRQSCQNQNLRRDTVEFGPFLKKAPEAIMLYDAHIHSGNTPTIVIQFIV